MKKILLFLSLFAGLFFSCDDYLTKYPLNYVDESNFWKTKEHAVQGVTAVYASLQSVYGNYVLNDMYSPIADETSNGDVNLGLHTARNSSFKDKWEILYRGINRANVAMEKIVDIDMDQTLKERLIGECKFLRALYYFNLIDFWGDVPLYLEEITVQNANKGRTPVEEIRNAIIKDLDDAIKVLDIKYETSETGRATKGAAIALKGKVYLYAGDYQKAVEMFEELVNNSDTYQYGILDNYADVFDYHNKNNKEVVFDVQYLGPKTGEGGSLDYWLGNLSCNGTGSTNTSCPTVELLDSYLCTNGLPITDSASGYDPANRYANRDKRMDITVMRPGTKFKGLDYVFPLQAGDYVKGRTRTGLMWRKYVVEDDGSAWGDDNQNYIVIRYADVLLMYAEAKNELLGTPDASIYNALNRLRERAGVKAIDISSKSKDEMRQLIRNERMIELAGEGIYYSDIRRWKVAASMLNGRSFKNLLGEVYTTRVFDEKKHYLWPIPQTEIEMNKALIQNPGF